MTETYEFTTKIMDKRINFRKWKVKDKKKFMNSNNDAKIIKEALVYDCIENKNISLDNEEYKYMLIKIREVSLPSKVSYEFTCSSCDKEFEYKADLNEIMKPEFKKYGDISFMNHTFKMSNIKNKTFYDNIISQLTVKEEIYLTDFILHVDAYNDNNGLSFDDFMNIINDLDIDIFEELFKQWEKMRFKINNIHDVPCPHCKSIEQYEFDDLPHFFPDSWVI